jgi:hypothetical protein
MGFEFAGTVQRLVGGVRCPRGKSIPLEYEGQGVGNQTIIVNDQNSLHGSPFSIRFCMTQNAFNKVSLGLKKHLCRVKIRRFQQVEELTPLFQ